MGLFSGNSKDAAIKEHKAAKANLEKVASKSKDETPAYLRANQRVADAEKNVPWYRR